MTTSEYPGTQIINAETVRFRRGRLNLSGSLTRRNEMQFYKFRVSSYSDFQSSVNRQEGNVRLVLFNRRGHLIESSNEDDGEPEEISTKLRKGTYYIGLQRISGRIEYRMRARRQDAPGFRRRDALQLSSSELTNGRFRYRGTIDGSEERFNYFRVDVERTSTFSSFVRELEGDFTYKIFDEDKRRVFVSSSDESIESFDRLLTQGTYFIQVKTTSRRETRYQLNFNLSRTEVAEFEDDGSGTFSYSKEITDLSSDTYYTLDLASASRLDLSVLNLSADVDLELLSSSGSVLYQSISARRSQENLRVRLNAGTYYVRVFTDVVDETVSCDLNFNYTTISTTNITNSTTLENGYQITFNGVDYIGDTSVWEYSVLELPAAQDLSNWVLELPSSSTVLSSSPGGELVDPDPNAQISGIKWETSATFTEGIFTVTLDGTPGSGLINVAAKGPDVVLGRLTGPLDCGCEIDDDDDDDDDDD